MLRKRERGGFCWPGEKGEGKKTKRTPFLFLNQREEKKNTARKRKKENGTYSLVSPSLISTKERASRGDSAFLSQKKKKGKNGLRGGVKRKRKKKKLGCGENMGKG